MLSATSITTTKRIFIHCAVFFLPPSLSLALFFLLIFPPIDESREKPLLALCSKAHTNSVCAHLLLLKRAKEPGTIFFSNKEHTTHTHSAFLITLEVPDLIENNNNKYDVRWEKTIFERYKNKRWEKNSNAKENCVCVCVEGLGECVNENTTHFGSWNHAKIT